MSEHLSNQIEYKITLEGCLDGCWAASFDGLTMTVQHDPNAITILNGLVADQPALRGLLNQIWDFNLTVIAVERIEAVNRNP
ncbi:MAG: hypothetical protein DWQ04_14945 [Chloroflexi bacterium]|nr:MAG: hypothetical protein DWQ04_14945 [Chloroflexota bacterium]